MTTPGFFRLAGWAALLSAVMTLLMVITGVLMFTANPFFGGLSDLFSVLAAALMIPVVVGLHLILRSEAPALRLAAAAIGLLGILVVGVAQSLLVLGVITYEQGSASSGRIGPAGIGIWLLLANYLALRGKILPKGLVWVGLITGLGYLIFMASFWFGGLDSPLLFIGSGLAYWGYPIWAIWLGRWLLTRLS